MSDQYVLRNWSKEKERPIVAAHWLHAEVRRELYLHMPVGARTWNCFRCIDAVLAHTKTAVVVASPADDLTHVGGFVVYQQAKGALPHVFFAHGPGPGIGLGQVTKHPSFPFPFFEAAAMRERTTKTVGGRMWRRRLKQTCVLAGLVEPHGGATVNTSPLEAL